MPRGSRECDSPFYIPNQEPHLYYYWITCADPMRMAKHLLPRGKRAAYTIVRGATLEDTRDLCRKLGVAPEMVSESRNWIQYGTSVMATIPMAEHQQRIADQKADARQREMDSDESFYARFEGTKGVKGVKRETEEWDDRRKHATSKRAFLSMSTVKK